MPNPTETTDASYSLATLGSRTLKQALEAWEDSTGETATDETAQDENIMPRVTWDDGSALIVVQGARADLIEFFARALKLAEDLPPDED